jgi:hypothetical protein
MANLARLKTSLISAPIHFLFRAELAHQQPVLLPIRMPRDFGDRHLRDRNERLPLATAIAAAWLCVVTRPWHGANATTRLACRLRDMANNGTIDF